MHIDLPASTTVAVTVPVGSGRPAMALASTFQLWFHFTALLLPDVNTVVPGLKDDDGLPSLPPRLDTSLRAHC